MDFSFIEQLLGLSRIRVSDVQQTDDEIIISVYVPEGRHLCPRCGRYHNKVTEITEIKVRDLSVFGKSCYLIIRKGRLHCPCSYRGYEQLECVDKYQKQTTRYNEFLFQLCDRMTIMDASELMHVSWKRAYKTDRNTLEDIMLSTSLPEMTVIGVDEISFQKYHRYYTIVYDLADKNGVLFVSEGRREESLNAYFKNLTQEQRKGIKVVCMDTWDPYIASVHKNLPHADIVFDRFHLKKHLNQCIDELRRSLVNESPKDQKRVIKNKRWVLLKKQSNHTQKDQEALMELKTINLPLYEAYLIKEQFDQFFEYKYAKCAQRFLEKWYQAIPATIKKHFESFYQMLKNYFNGVITYFKYRITNSIAEGINNKIKVLKRMAYGYRDHEYFKLKILRRCGYLKNVQPNF
jgi:transposase